MHSNGSTAPGAPDQGAPRPWQSMALAALGGPVALGAIVGLEIGPLAALSKSLALPAVLAGVAAVMVPALYISATITGVAPPARDMARSLARGFRACGLVMLGLAAPALFLLATTQTSDVAVVVGGGVTAAGVLVGLRVLFADLFERGALLARAAFAVWSLVALIMGMRLYAEFIA
jgi:hypothetical protein